MELPGHSSFDLKFGSLSLHQFCVTIAVWGVAPPWTSVAYPGYCTKFRSSILSVFFFLSIQCRFQLFLKNFIHIIFCIFSLPNGTMCSFDKLITTITPYIKTLTLDSLLHFLVDLPPFYSLCILCSRLSFLTTPTIVKGRLVSELLICSRPVFTLSLYHLQWSALNW